jgi:hypothetical protein
MESASQNAVMIQTVPLEWCATQMETANLAAETTLSARDGMLNVPAVCGVTLTMETLI